MKRVPVPSPVPRAVLLTHCPMCGDFLRHLHRADQGLCPTHGVMETPLQPGWAIVDKVLTWVGIEATETAKTATKQYMLSIAEFGDSYITPEIVKRLIEDHIPGTTVIVSRV